MRGRGEGERVRMGGSTDAGSRRSKTTERSSTGTRAAAAADGGTNAPVDAARGGLDVDGARFLPDASAFSSPATAREAMVTVTLAQPSVYLRPATCDCTLTGAALVQGKTNAPASSSSGSAHLLLQHSIRPGNSGSAAPPPCPPSYTPRPASMAASGPASSSSRSDICAPAMEGGGGVGRGGGGCGMR